MTRRSSDSFAAGSRLRNSRPGVWGRLLAPFRQPTPGPEGAEQPSAYVTACCGAVIQIHAEETLTAWDGDMSATVDLHVAKMASHAIQLEHATDLGEILPDFAFHFELLKRIGSDEETSLEAPDVDRHPIMFQYARRAAELAGVPVCRHEAVAAATEHARAWCERAARASQW